MSKREDDTKREQKRTAIMAAALKVFSKKGYSPAALDEVAREAQIAKGTLYLYFQDKQDLFSSTILHVIDNLATKMIEGLDESMTTLEILRNVAYIELEYFSKNTEFFGLIHTAMSGNLLGEHEPLINKITERRFELISYLNEVIQRAKKEGLIREEIDTEEIVYSYLGMVEAAMDQMGFTKGKPLLDVRKKVN
ncbi:MAG: TetR/AcrR family transcriptional regulator, partial [Spirochaetota bacterium]